MRGTKRVAPSLPPPPVATSDFLVKVDVPLASAQNAQHCITDALSVEEIMQIYQGNFVADIESIKSTRRLQPTHFRIRVSQLRPVELLISDSVATDAHAARERAEAKFRELLACEQVLNKAA
jgi:hypothetical protein